MSIILVTFPGAPQPNPEAIKKDQHLNEVLEKRVEGTKEELCLMNCWFCVYYKEEKNGK